MASVLSLRAALHLKQPAQAALGLVQAQLQEAGSKLAAAELEAVRLHTT